MRLGYVCNSALIVISLSAFNFAKCMGAVEKGDEIVGVTNHLAKDVFDDKKKLDHNMNTMQKTVSTTESLQMQLEEFSIKDKRFKYLGCFKDDTSARALPKRKGSGSIFKCRTRCTGAGYKYSARQGNGECWCGNSGYDKYGKTGGCKCGEADVGSMKQCVFEDKAYEPPKPFVRYKYLGCFKDSEVRALPERKRNGSVTQCNEQCTAAGYEYSGRQWKGECWCGNNGYDTYGQADGCDCDGSNVGAWMNCVYKDRKKVSRGVKISES